jgi:MinD superfamily P-loop ATPase
MQLVVISGKGGTGKTTVAASFAYLSQESIKVDCDVDASNLHLLLHGEDIEQRQFIGAKVAQIDSMKCTQCGKCQQVCRYHAIQNFVVNALRCEGCAACTVVCPEKAISLMDEITGKTMITKTDRGILSRAEMCIGAEGSGKLVTEIKKNALHYRKKDEWMILDGTPGVGCAVMASITGCDAALIVVEPTQSGFEDFLRVLSVSDFFSVRSFVCINKYDINEGITEKIEKFCKEEDVEMIGKIPFDTLVQESINALKPIVTYDKSIAGKEIIKMWNLLNEKYYQKYEEDDEK